MFQYAWQQMHLQITNTCMLMYHPLPMDIFCWIQTQGIIWPMSTIFHHLSKNNLIPFNIIGSRNILLHYILNPFNGGFRNPLICIQIKNPIGIYLLQGKITLTSKAIIPHRMINKSSPSLLGQSFCIILTARIHHQNVVCKRGAGNTILYVFFFILG